MNEAKNLPPMAQEVFDEHPQLGESYKRLGTAASEAGPLELRERRLIHLAMAIAIGSEGATHSHTRRAIEEGCSVDQLEHVALLGITTLGWPQAIRGLSWIRDTAKADVEGRPSATRP